MPVSFTFIGASETRLELTYQPFKDSIRPLSNFMPHSKTALLMVDVTTIVFVGSNPHIPFLLQQMIFRANP
jgi:hypothetical protein